MKRKSSTGWVVAVVLAGLGGCGRVGYELYTSSAPRSSDGSRATVATDTPSAGLSEISTPVDAGCEDCFGAEDASYLPNASPASIAASVTAIQAGDEDGDGVPNAEDGCPDNPDKTAAGVCGCGLADTDTDLDGSADCEDACPADPAKVEPGACGCGTPDTDNDQDGIPNCQDGCPDGDDTVQPGACGCGIIDADSDQDGVQDCEDGCPEDPAKTSPGFCGCGNPDTDDGASLACDGLRSALQHRYRFADTGSVARDSVGSADGQVIDTTLPGDGTLPLTGDGTNEHVQLPAGLWSGFANATLEMWVTWTGYPSARWQRLFDFGVSRPASLASPDTCISSDPVRRSDGTWYYYCLNELPWPNAQAACGDGSLSSQAELLRLEDESEERFVVDHAPGPAYWMGANDLASEGSWHWCVNGDCSAERFWEADRVVDNAYVHWRSGEPNNQFDEDCGELQTADSLWNDVSCDWLRAFICEAPADPSAPYSSFYVSVSGVADSSPRVGIVRPAVAEYSVDSANTFPSNARSHVAVVYDSSNDRLTLWVDGTVFGELSNIPPLSVFADEQNYLGRSHYGADPNFQGVLHEVRIYDRALSADQVAISRRAGPDAAYLE